MLRVKSEAAKPELGDGADAPEGLGCQPTTDAGLRPPPAHPEGVQTHGKERTATTNKPQQEPVLCNDE